MKRMVRMLALLLALALMTAVGGALAEVDVISGNISNGGIAAKDEQGRLWFNMGGLMRLEADGSTTCVMEIPSGEVRCLQAVGDDIYFVLRTPVSGEDSFGDSYAETLWRIGTDDIPVQLGTELIVAEYRQYGDEDYHLVSSTTHNGYGDMTVYGDHIYFIGTDYDPGTYITNATGWGGCGEVETAYDGQSVVYRMDLDGENLTPLISGLGNGDAHMAIANNRIAVASCFRNAVFAYDFSNFMLYDLEGSLISVIPNNTEGRHEGIYKEEEEFTVIVSSIQTDGERIYASLCDSEGDFMSSRLVDLSDGTDETIAIEVFYAGSLVTDRGIFYITADVEDTYWQEDMEYTVTLRHRAPDGSDTLLAHIPYNYVGYDMKMALLGDELYVSLKNNLSAYMDATIEQVNPNEGILLRVKLDSGAVDELGENGFAVSMACDPEYYTPPVLAWQQADGEDIELLNELAEMDEVDSYLLPDSDVYLYSAEELQDYDKDTLALMRNEILARHGYVFKKEVYRNYFSGKSWYSEDPDFDYNSLNAVEMENVETIKKLEEKK